MTSKNQALRQALEGSPIALAPAAFNAQTAALIAKAGFPITVMGGSTVSNTLLGLPDAGFLTLTDMEYMVAKATAVCPIPMLVDIDNGYGNAINVRHTIRTLEHAGASGVLLEDQASPKRSGHIAGRAVIAQEEMVGKVRAAADARESADFLIIARTDARSVEGLESAIERSSRYVEAGADGYFADGLLSVEEMERVAREVRASFRFINIGGSAKKRTTPKLPLDQLEAMGYDCALFGLQLVRASTLAMLRFLETLRTQGIEADLQLLRDLEGTPIEEWYEFTGFNEIREQEAQYLPEADVIARYERSQPGYYEPQPSARRDEITAR